MGKSVTGEDYKILQIDLRNSNTEITKTILYFFNFIFFLFACLCVSFLAAVQSVSHPLLLPYFFPKPFPQAHPIQRQIPLFSGLSHSGTNLPELSCLSPVNPIIQFTHAFNHWPVKSSTECPHNRVIGSQQDKGNDQKRPLS